MRNRILGRVWHLIACSGLLLSVGTLHGCTGANSDAGLPAADDDMRDVDLGKLTSEDEPRHVFRIRNTTNKAFTITSIEKSCGCQTTNVAEGMVVPAGGVLVAPYALQKNRAGPQSGRLTITTDARDGSFKEIELVLRAEIQAKLWATPAHLHLVAGSEDESAEQELRVESIVPGLLDSFKEVATSRDNVTVKLERKTREALIFRVSSSADCPMGEAFDLVYLRFNHVVHPSLNVRVRIRKGRRIAAIPKVMRLPAFADATPLTRRVRVMSTSQADGPFRIRQVDCPAGVTVGEYPDEPRYAFDVTVTFEKPIETGAGNAITFHTVPPGRATVSVLSSSAVDQLSSKGAP